MSVVRKGCGCLLVAAGLFLVVYVGLAIDGVDEGCFPLLKRVSFPSGAYRGTVVDAGTGLPIEGAVVVTAIAAGHTVNDWKAFRQMGVGRTVETVLDWSVGRTGPDGAYSFPKEPVRRWMHWRTGKPEFRVFVYKKGYVGYGNGAVFDGHRAVNKPAEAVPGPVTRVALQPWQPGYDHLKHVEFLNRSLPSWGDDSEAAKAFSWERSVGEGMKP
jgi:hypothetical protein